MNWLNLSRELAIVYWSVMGLFVGSFLNVAIHRLPLAGETVSKPRRSRCPKSVSYTHLTLPTNREV